MKLVTGFASSRIGRSIRNRSISPRTASRRRRPARRGSRPKTDAYLNPWAAPSATRTFGCVGQPIDDEVAVRRQRVEAGLRVDRRPEHARAGGARGSRSGGRRRPRRGRTSGRRASSLRRRRPGRPSGPARRTSGSRRSTGRPSRSRSGSGPGAKAAGSGQAKYVTCSFVIVSGSRRSKSRSSSFVQASAARTTCPARWTVPSAVVDLDPAAGVPAAASPGSGRGAWRRSPGRGAGGRRCRGSGRRGRTSAWYRPWCSSPSRHCGQRRMISGAVEVLVRDALGVHRAV